MVAAPARAVADPRLLHPEQRRSQTGSYDRHILHGDPAGRFTIVSIVWDPGRFSPPRAHHAWCSYAVHENWLGEALYAWDAGSNRAGIGRTEARALGYGCFSPSGFDQIHRLGNCSPEPAISIHVYGVACERMASHVNRLVETAMRGCGS